VPLPSRPTPENVTYLRTKQDRMGHLFGVRDVSAENRGSLTFSELL
ncbi:MAG: hypothetical protein JWP31_1162, partial [Aeromicrobium sp.]|nr:hypothetical protein [Aeromicrobium sp.]